jgi:ribonuclease HI
MIRSDFRAIYIHCDGSMMYDTDSSGGTGQVIKFPDFLDLEDVSESDGIFVDSNIERLELEGITSGMQALRDYIKLNGVDLSRISKIIVITDRFALKDDERTSPYRIKDWRSNGGKNFEDKEIKNWDLINLLDKTRTRLANEARKSVRIEYRKRKYNKEADKLSKKGRNEGIVNRKIAIEGHKIGRRKFDGQEINYKLFSPKEKIKINVFRKRLIKNQWEINAEICSGKKNGNKLKIYCDYKLQEKLQRGNEYEITVKKVFSYHFEIYRTIKKIKKI